MNELLSKANLITFSRILATVPMVFLLSSFAPDHVGSMPFPRYTLAFLCILYAAYSDYWDGQVARATKTASALGNSLDPVADKIFILWALFMLDIPMWLILAILTRDIWIMMLRTIAECTKTPFHTSYFAKLKTGLLFAFVLAESFARAFYPGMDLWERVYATELIVIFVVGTAMHYTLTFCYRLHTHA